MKRILALFLASVGVLVAVAAQGAEIDLQRNEPAIINGVLYPVSGTPLVLPAMETVLAAFATTQSEINAVANLTDQSVVKVIVVNPMIVANADALDRAKSDNRRDVDRLQAAINANSRLKTDLETRRVDVATVLAAELAPDGVLVIYALA